MADIFDINVIAGASVEDTIRKFNNRPITRKIGGEFSRTFKALQVKLTKDFVAIATDAAKSAVPYHVDRGGTLRNSILDNRNKINAGNLVGHVWADNRTHQPPYNFYRKPEDFSYISGKTREVSNPEPLASSTLADILNTGFNPRGGLYRTRASVNEPGFQSIRAGSPTADWVGAAERDFSLASTVYLAVTAGKKIDVYSFLEGTYKQQLSPIAQLTENIKQERIDIQKAKNPPKAERSKRRIKAKKEDKLKLSIFDTELE